MTASTLELIRPRRERPVRYSKQFVTSTAWGEDRWVDEDPLIEGAHTFFTAPDATAPSLPDADGDQIRYEGFVQQNIVNLLSVVRAHAFRVARDKEHLQGKGRKKYLGYEEQVDQLHEYMYWAPSWSKYVPVITFDVDNVYDHTTYNELPLPPNWIGINPIKGTSQGIYFLDSPVAGATNPLRKTVSSVRAGIHTALDGDPNFVGNVARTPGHDAYDWHHQHDYRYSLKELLDAFVTVTPTIDQGQRRFVNLRTRQVEMTRDDGGLIMRQTFLYERARWIAYSKRATGVEIDVRWLHYEVLKPLEAEVARLEDREPIPESAIKSIARSISNFCNTKMSGSYSGSGVSFYTHAQRVKGGQTQGRINASNGTLAQAREIRRTVDKELNRPAFSQEASVKGGKQQGRINAMPGGSLESGRQTSQTVRSVGKIMKAALARELKLASPELTNGELAARVGVSERTIRTYLNAE